MCIYKYKSIFLSLNIFFSLFFFFSLSLSLSLSLFLPSFHLIVPFHPCLSPLQVPCIFPHPSFSPPFPPFVPVFPSSISLLFYFPWFEFFRSTSEAHTQGVHKGHEAPMLTQPLLLGEKINFFCYIHMYIHI